MPAGEAGSLGSCLASVRANALLRNLSITICFCFFPQWRNVLSEISSEFCPVLPLSFQMKMAKKTESLAE